MIRALRILRKSLSDWYYELFLLLAANAVWIVLSILVIPWGPATAGLFHLSNEVAKGEPVTFGLFWIGLRRYLGLSFKLFLLIIFITVLIFANMVFYLNLHSTVGQVIGIVWIYVLILWGLVLNFPFAMMVQMEKPTLMRIVRNSVLMVLDNVAFTVSMSLLTLLTLFVCFLLGFLPLLLGYFAFLAIFQCKCMAVLFEKYENRQGATPTSSA
jgi:uncharacterized membrane protein YesL